MEMGYLSRDWVFMSRSLKVHKAGTGSSSIQLPRSDSDHAGILGEVSRDLHAVFLGLVHLAHVDWILILLSGGVRGQK